MPNSIICSIIIVGSDIVKIKKKNLAIIYMIASALFFALMSTFVRLSGDLPTFQKMFFRNLIAAIIASIILIKNKVGVLPVKNKNIPYLIMRISFGMIGVFCNFYALDRLLLADASILNKMSPFFAIIFSIFLLKEKPSIWQSAIVVVAFLGSLFVIKPSFQNAQLFPSLMGFISGVFAGAAYACVRKLTTNGEHSSYVVFAFSAASTIVLLPLFIYYYQPMSMYQFVMLLLAGCSAAGGQIFVTLSYKNAPSKEVSVYGFSQILFTAVIAFFTLSQIPDLYSVVGYVIIISMAIMSFLYSNNMLFFKNKEKNKTDTR